MKTRLLLASSLAALAAVVGCSKRSVPAIGGSGGAFAASSTQVSTGTSGKSSSATTVASAPASSTVTSTAGQGGAAATSGGGGAGGVAIKCDPVTNQPCSGMAECDINLDNQAVYHGFDCFMPGMNDGAKPCDPCDLSKQQYCQGTLSCGANYGLGNKCTRYCCTDADCGTGKCVKTGLTNLPFQGATDLGVCTDATGKAPSCDAPATAPSMGTCVKPGM